MENLSSNARKLLDFVVKDVSSDYQGFLTIGEQYDKDGASVDILMRELRQLIAAVPEQYSQINFCIFDAPMAH